MNWFLCMIVMGQMQCQGPLPSQEECASAYKSLMAQITSEQIKERQIIGGCFGTEQMFPGSPDQRKA